jgi:Tic22-like family
MKSLMSLKAMSNRLRPAFAIGSGAAAGVLLTALQAFALPQEQILEKLDPLLVFTLADAQGAPLVALPPDGKKGNPTAGIFMSKKDADGLLENLRKNNPEVAKNVSVLTVSMSEIYQLQMKAVEKKSPMVFAFVPTREQVASAVELLKASGQKDAKTFPGTPVFAARAGKDKAFLTMPQPKDGKPVIPFFFNKEQLQPLLDDLKKQQPELAATVDIQVFPFEGVLDAMKNRKEPGLEQVVLVPSPEALTLLQEASKAAAANKKK